MESDLVKLEEEFLRLMRQRKFGEAVELLQSSHAEARRAMDTESSSYISTLLAASLIASGRDEEALQALRQAQEDEPSDAFLKLRIATHLLGNLKRPDESTGRTTD